MDLPVLIHVRCVLCDMLIAAVSWGSGGFTVQKGGSLSLANMAVNMITVQGGGSLSVNDGACKIGTLATLEGSRLSIYGLFMAVAKNQLVIFTRTTIEGLTIFSTCEVNGHLIIVLRSTLNRLIFLSLFTQLFDHCVEV